MKVAERVARLLITIGGIGTILAVTLIFVFLVAVVLPLFTKPEVSAAHSVASRADAADAQRLPVHVAIDPYRVLSATLFEDGSIEVRRLEDGSLLETQRIGSEGDELAAFRAAPAGEDVAVAFADGRMRTGTFGFSESWPVGEDVPQVAEGERVAFQGGLLELTPEGKPRLQRFRLALGEVLDPELDGARPLLLDFAGEDEDRALVVLTDNDRLAIVKTETNLDWMTGEETFEAIAYELPYEADPDLVPNSLLLAGQSDVVYLIAEDGATKRFVVRDPEEPYLAEELDLVEDPRATLTSVGFLLGRSTILVGDSNGALHAWFPTKPDDAPTVDRTITTRVHVLRESGSPVMSLASSSRSRLVATGHQDGTVRLFHVTTANELVSVQSPDDSGFRALAISPKEDAIVAWGAAGLTEWDIDPRHPSAGFKAFFTPVWYEGYVGPEHTWQSDSASDDFEPKYGFMPLVFGTLKATFYTMIFGAPLALLAAIFTSEFLDRRLRTPIKSSIEMMASLPSVVLGFLAALVIAPFAQTIIPATLAIFLTIPLALLAGAYLWQLLPQSTAIRLSGWPRLLAMGAMTLLIGIPGALAVGPVLETLFFAGDMELWLDGQAGNAVGGWMFLTLPLCALLVAFFGGRSSAAWMRKRGAAWTRRQTAVFDIARFGVLFVGVVATSLLLAFVLSSIGLDTRGTFLDTYVQRNALVVGFVMGFAVIPIIYTLAEDALSSVPEHLRLASLGAGATQWQTATRVIIPTAMSGLFSALMIGLGRAVGETMIVLMATGNTPVLEMNLFNGFRTLSANIAVELPEAAQGSTHYRALFLAGLVLFAMTFVLNTAAEGVRQRFRKRAFQL